jgi:hypothetical protein
MMPIKKAQLKNKILFVCSLLAVLLMPVLAFAEEA